MTYTPTLIGKLNAIANEYRDKIEQSIFDVLSKRRYRHLDSIQVKMIPGTKDRSPDIIVTMDDHLNILNKRKIEWTKLPPVDDFNEWSQDKTFSGPVPGYKNGLAPNLPPWKAKQRIIWAIAKSKQKFDKWKPQPWRKKALSSVLKEMNVEIQLAYNQAIEQDTVEAFNLGLKGQT